MYKDKTCLGGNKKAASGNPIPLNGLMQGYPSEPTFF